MDENKALVRRYWEEVWNQGNLALIDELFAPPMVDARRNFISKTRDAFENSHVIIEDEIAEGDRVVTRYRWEAIHRGVWDIALHGISMAVPPTGQPVWNQGIAIFQVANGKLVASWSEWTEFELAQQIGALPTNLAK